MQTLAPGHYALTCAVAHDYEAFYGEEIDQRAPEFSQMRPARIVGRQQGCEAAEQRASAGGRCRFRGGQ